MTSNSQPITLIHILSQKNCFLCFVEELIYCWFRFFAPIHFHKIWKFSFTVLLQMNEIKGKSIFQIFMVWVHVWCARRRLLHIYVGQFFQNENNIKIYEYEKRRRRRENNKRPEVNEVRSQWRLCLFTTIIYKWVRCCFFFVCGSLVFSLPVACCLCVTSSFLIYKQSKFIYAWLRYTVLIRKSISISMKIMN